MNDNSNSSKSNDGRRMLKVKRHKLLMPVNLTTDSAVDDSDVEQLSPPLKLKTSRLISQSSYVISDVDHQGEKSRRIVIIKKKLFSYMVLAKNVENDEITIEEANELADFRDFLWYQIGAVARSLDGTVYPIMIKTIFHPKPIADVVASRNNCFIRKGNNNNWRIKKFGKEWLLLTIR